MQEVKSRKYSL